MVPHYQERFGVRYSHCGCPLPGDTIGQRLSRFVSSATSKSPKLSEEVGPPSDLVPPPNRPDLVAATHASEHNSIQFIPRNNTSYRRSVSAWREHQGTVAKRVKKREQDVAGRPKGKQDDGRAAQCWYGMAFILPVPLMLGAGVAGGVVVDHGGACGNVRPPALLRIPILI